MFKDGDTVAPGPRTTAQEAGISLLEVLRRSTSHLQSHGSSSSRLDAELLLARALGLSRVDLYQQFDRLLDAAELSRLRPLVAARAQGSPVAYLLGERAFHGLTFTVTPAGLIPRPETELLVDLAVSRAGAGPVRILDLGCGTGCIGITLASLIPSASVDLVDLEPAVLALAAGNVERHRVGPRVTCHLGSWVEAIAGLPGYNLIVSNPPYVTTSEWARLEPTVRDFEPRVALDGGSDGLAAYRKLLPQLTGAAAPGAVILLEGDPRRLPLVRAMASNIWAHARTEIHQDLAHRDRFLELRLP